MSIGLNRPTMALCATRLTRKKPLRVVDLSERCTKTLSFSASIKAMTMVLTTMLPGSMLLVTHHYDLTYR